MHPTHSRPFITHRKMQLEKNSRFYRLFFIFFIQNFQIRTSFDLKINFLKDRLIIVLAEHNKFFNFSKLSERLIYLQNVFFAGMAALTPITLKKIGANDRYKTNHYRISWNNTSRYEKWLVL